MKLYHHCGLPLMVTENASARSRNWAEIYAIKAMTIHGRVLPASQLPA